MSSYSSTMAGAVELLSRTWQPRAASSVTSSCSRRWSSSENPDAVYDVKLAVVLTGALTIAEYQTEKAARALAEPG